MQVVALVVDNEGCVLLTQRAQHMRIFPGFWVLPGGHVDSGESLLNAAAREVRCGEVASLRR